MYKYLHLLFSTKLKHLWQNVFGYDAFYTYIGRFYPIRLQISVSQSHAATKMLHCWASIEQCLDFSKHLDVAPNRLFLASSLVNLVSSV